MNFLEKLTDISLRRLYKFVIKRTIGQYLEDDLVLDQVSVSSRDGRVVISDLALNCDVLNMEFIDVMNLPYKITKASIGSLEGKLSYTLLLAEGCKFQANSIEIVIEPKNQTKITQTKSKSLDSNQNENSNISSNAKVVEDNGVEYIAHWIEVIIASLQFHVNDITIIVRDPTSNIDLIVKLSKTSFFNSNPQQLRMANESSASFSSKSYKTNTQSSIASPISDKKVIYKLDLILTI